MKIFIAVGTQLAFDRLLKAVDDWAANHPEAEIFAQAGPAKYQPQHMQFQHFVPPQIFKQKSEEADVIVAHAGTGSIFTALELQKPLVVMPRLARYHEHRNDHQLATAERFKDRPGINVAWDEHDVPKLLDDPDALSRPSAAFSAHASPELLETLRSFIDDDAPVRARDRVLKLARAFRI